MSETSGGESSQDGLLAAKQQVESIIQREVGSGDGPGRAEEEDSRKRFDPTAYGLSETYCLTDFTQVTTEYFWEKLTCSYNCKGNDLKPNETPGLDSSVVKIGAGQDLYLISTTDFFYPNVDDPYTQGKIACANVLSDLYAMGVTSVDSMLMILGVSRDMEMKERDVTTTLMIKGFNETAKLAGTNVTGGQTVLNPWPIVGGVAMSVRKGSEFIRPHGAVAGDVIVLTKPLGTQVAVNAYQWLKKPNWANISHAITREEVIDLMFQAEESMTRLNANAAKLMHEYGAHAATDVTGFGILGHLKNLAKSQAAEVSLELHTLPVMAKAALVNRVRNNGFRLFTGFSAETSGGLLVCLPRENAQAFIDHLQRLDGKPAWIIGDVVAGSRTGKLCDDIKILEVS